MNIRTLYLLWSIMLGASRLSAAGEISNPLHEYIDFHALTKGCIIYKWNIDLKANGGHVILLAAKAGPDDIAEYESDTKEKYNPNIEGFTPYFVNPHGSGYVKSKGLDSGGMMGVDTLLMVDITRCFTGKITELGKWGLVTVSPTGRSQDGSPIAAIYAYTVEGDHVKETRLAQYDPTKGSNPIYDQYLKEGKRTKVKLEEIMVKPV